MRSFNIRIYGICLSEGRVLLSQEKICGKTILKFPGGGLEFGEGLKDGLCREWMEELNVSVKVGKHFYTTDFFQPSAWDDSQVISIYYMVQPVGDISMPLNNGQEAFDWYPVDDKLETILTLPIDKIVGLQLAQMFAR